jgi:hypothetical protein
MEAIDSIQEISSQDQGSKLIDGLLYLGSIILGLWFVFLFYKKLVGISFLLFMVAFYLLVFIAFRRKIKFRPLISWFLLFVVLILSSSYFIFTNALFMVLNFFMILFLVVSHQLLITGLHESPWDQLKFIPETILNFFEKAFSNLPRFSLDSFFNLKSFSDNNKVNTMRKVLIGIVISIPIIFIVIALLAFADDVFRYYMNDLFQSIKLADLFNQLFIFFLATSLVYGFLWSFMCSRKVENGDKSQEKIRPTKSLDSVISMTFLLMFNFVYLGFFLVKYAYMFGAINYVLPEGFLPAEYARKGFSELLIIALINFTIYVIFIKFKPLAGKTYAFFLNILTSSLVLFTLAILFSAHLRMTLYEAAFGYTYLRVLTHGFMIFLFTLIIVALFKIWIKQVPLKKLYIVLSLVAFMLVNYANIDKMIASRNIERYHLSGEIDDYYLQRLSFDSYPDLVEFYIRYESSSHLYRAFHQKNEILSKTKHWASFNLARRDAKKALDRFFKMEQLKLSPFQGKVEKMEF